MKRVLLLSAALAVLAVAWLGPLPRQAAAHFSAHMLVHVAVVALAAPLLALALAGHRLDPVRRMPALFAPIPASVLELIVVWAWHVPALHALARQQTFAFVLEQAGFLFAGWLVWLSAFGGSRHQRRERALAAIAALLLTATHMTLLGVLLAVSDRLLYAHGGMLHEQHLGGVIMLFAGGASYLAGALWRVAGLLREDADAMALR